MTGNNVGNHATLKWMRIGESNELDVEFAIPRDNHMIIELVTEKQSIFPQEI